MDDYKTMVVLINRLRFTGAPIDVAEIGEEFDGNGKRNSPTRVNVREKRK